MQGAPCSQPPSRQLLRHVPINNRTKITVALSISLDDLLIDPYIRTWQRMLHLEHLLTQSLPLSNQLKIWLPLLALRMDQIS